MGPNQLSPPLTSCFLHKELWCESKATFTRSLTPPGHSLHGGATRPEMDPKHFGYFQMICHFHSAQQKKWADLLPFWRKGYWICFPSSHNDKPSGHLGIKRIQSFYCTDPNICNLGFKHIEIPSWYLISELFPIGKNPLLMWEEMLLPPNSHHCQHGFVHCATIVFIFPKHKKMQLAG